MARGWESKSVEAQQEDAATRNTPGKPRLTREEASRQRDKENLRLSLQSVIRELDLSRNDRRRTTLEQAKSDLERRIEQLGT